MKRWNATKFAGSFWKSIIRGAKREIAVIEFQTNFRRFFVDRQKSTGNCAGPDERWPQIDASHDTIGALLNVAELSCLCFFPFSFSLSFFSSHLLITALYSVIFPCYGSGVFDFSKRYPKKWSFLPRNVVIQRVKSVSIVSYLFRSGERSETRKKRLERGKNTVVRRLPRVKLEKIKLR